MLKLIVQKSLNRDQLYAICRLWNNEYPQEMGYARDEEFSDYLDRLDDKVHFLLIDEQNLIVGWSATFLRENERWFAIILSSNFHGRGYGTKILNEIKKRESRLVGWVLDREGARCSNGRTYRPPLEFYLKNGFRVLQDVRIEFSGLSAVKIEWK